jgi:hypothetical protein
LRDAPENSYILMAVEIQVGVLKVCSSNGSIKVNLSYINPQGVTHNIGNIWRLRYEMDYTGSYDRPGLGLLSGVPIAGQQRGR